jgi:hypothetical protein
MARPVKIGLEYFPLDVDIFDDEKVIPISSEFGIKGEIILIRVLCAIYRNGYFIECSESFKFKIAKQTNTSHALVGDVISGLARWGFFDETMFCSLGILTSLGIQKRWMEATRKRVINYDELQFWLLDVKDKKEFPAEETHVSGGRNYTKTTFKAEETTQKDTETTQKKVKENKVNNKEKEKRKEIAKRFLPPSIDEVKKFVSEKNYSVDPESFVAFYQSKNWFVGKNKMKDWRAAVVTWEKRNREFKKQTQPTNNVNDIWR